MGRCISDNKDLFEAQGLDRYDFHGEFYDYARLETRELLCE